MSAPRVVSLVLSDGDSPRAILAELLNAIEEHQEFGVLDFVRSPEFALFVACREIDAETEEGRAA